jgi:hypothetical protein
VSKEFFTVSWGLHGLPRGHCNKFGADLRINWHIITQRRALAKRGRETGGNKVGGAAGRRGAMAWRVLMTCRCAGEGRQNLTLHDAFSSAILTD